MPIEKERLIFFAYFSSPSYKRFLLEAAKTLGSSSPLDGDSILKVWEDGFLQFTALHTRRAVQIDTIACPIPAIVDANTGLAQRLASLDQLSPVDLVRLFAQIVNSGQDWQPRWGERVCDVCKGGHECDNAIVALLTKRLSSGQWDGLEKIAVLKRLVDAGVDDYTTAKIVCIAHELWGTHLWLERMAVYVDTVLGKGMSDETSRSVLEVRKTVEARRPQREMMAAFAAPAPFGLWSPARGVMYFSTPLLRVLPIGPVRVGTEEYRHLVKFAPLIDRLKNLKCSVPVQSMRLDRVQFFMEVYRLSVEVMHCQNRNTRAIDHLSCNRPHLRVPVDWRRAYNKMGVENIEDLKIE